MALVNVEAREHVLLIGLNHPEKMSAMNREMRRRSFCRLVASSSDRSGPGRGIAQIADIH